MKNPLQQYTDKLHTQTTAKATNSIPPKRPWHSIRLEEYRHLIQAFFLLAFLYVLGISAILRADFNYIDDLVFGLLKKGFTNLCFDGRPFFSDSHEIGGKKVSNMSHANLSFESYIVARASMMSLTNSKGRALALVPDKLVVPPALEKEARDILIADFINGTKNTMQGTAKPLVVPQLAGNDSSWFLLCTSRPVKPLIYQERKKPKFVSKTQETDDNVFFGRQFIYGVDARGNAGYSFWQMAYGSDGTADL